jgi:hypothetical protein
MRLVTTIRRRGGQRLHRSSAVWRRLRAAALTVTLLLLGPLPLDAEVFYGVVRGALFGCHDPYAGKAVVHIGVGRFGLYARSYPPPPDSYQAYTGSLPLVPDPLRPDEYDMVHASDWLVLGQRNHGLDVWDNAGTGQVAGFRHYPLPALPGSGARRSPHSTLFLRGVSEITHRELPSGEVTQTCAVDWTFNGQERTSPPKRPPHGKWRRDPSQPHLQHKAATSAGAGSKANAVAAATVAIPTCAAQTSCFGPTAGSAPELLVRSRLLRNGRVIILYLPLGARPTEVWSLRAGDAAAKARSWLVPEAPATGIARPGFVDVVGYTAAPESLAASEGPEAPDADGTAAFTHRWPAEAMVASGNAAPPAGPWLTTPALPGFRFKARLGRAALVTAATCPAETLCLGRARNAPAELFARVTARQPNGKRWLLAGKFADGAAGLWVQQGTSGPVRHYSLAARAPDSSWLPGVLDRAAFGR